MSTLLFNGTKKVCKRCGKEKEATQENFCRDSSTRDGLHDHCKPCRKAYIQEVKDRKAAGTFSPHRGRTPGSKSSPRVRYQEVDESGIHTFVQRVKITEYEGKVRKVFLHLCPYCDGQVKMEWLDSDEYEDSYFGGCTKCGCEVEAKISKNNKK